MVGEREGRAEPAGARDRGRDAEHLLAPVAGHRGTFAERRGRRPGSSADGPQTAQAIFGRVKPQVRGLAARACTEAYRPARPLQAGDLRNRCYSAWSGLLSSAPTTESMAAHVWSCASGRSRHADEQRGVVVPQRVEDQRVCSSACSPCWSRGPTAWGTRPTRLRRCAPRGRGSLTADIDTLLQAKPHLTGRRVVGDIRQGAGAAEDGSAGVGLLPARAQLSRPPCGTRSAPAPARSCHRGHGCPPRTLRPTSAHKTVSVDSRRQPSRSISPTS